MATLRILALGLLLGTVTVARAQGRCNDDDTNMPAAQKAASQVVILSLIHI